MSNVIITAIGTLDMHPITRLIIRIAHGDEILFVAGVVAIAMLVAAAVNMPVPQ